MAKQKAVAIVVPHTHWDREWRYLTNLNEERQTELAVSDSNRLRVKVAAHKIVTIEIDVY